MTSLRLRLGSGLVLSLIMLIVLLWMITASSVHSLMEEQLASRLAHDGESLLGGLNVGPDGRVSIDKQRVQGIYHQPYSGHYFQILAGEGKIRSRSLWDAELAVPAVSVGETSLSYISGPEQQPLLLWTRAYRKRGADIQIAVAEDLLTLQAGTRRLKVRLLTWSAVVVMLLLMIQQFIVMRSLRPVSEAANDVSRLEQGEINKVREEVPEEVRPLVLAINMLLERQQQRLIRSRESLGNLAHAIKTPLTLLQQLASEKLSASDRHIQEQFQRHINQINVMVDKSLRRARIAGGGSGASYFDLHKDLDALVDTVSLLHKDRTIAFQSSFHGVKQLPVEQQDGMELLGNLLDNAWKWACSTVSLSVNSNDHIEIIIEDDGPGVNADELIKLTRRGVRFDEAAPGHGIGLSIVSNLVEDMGGTIRFAPSDQLGGLKVTVNLAV